MLTTSDFIQFFESLKNVETMAFGLWTWLPSNMIMERYHSDNVSEFIPEPDWIMEEACELFAAFEGYDSDSIQLDIDAPFRCKCGQTHIPVDDDHPEWGGHIEDQIRDRLNKINSLIKLARENTNG